MVSQEWHWEQAGKFAVESIKTTLLLNGAAAIALMTFANTRKFSGALICPLVWFCHRSDAIGVRFFGRVSLPTGIWKRCAARDW